MGLLGKPQQDALPSEVPAGHARHAGIFANARAQITSRHELCHQHHLHAEANLCLYLNFQCLDGVHDTTSSETLVSQGLPEAKLLACLLSPCTEMVIARMQGQTAAASRRQTELHEYAHLPILFKYMSQIVDYMWVSQGLQKLCFHLELILLDQIPTCQNLHCHCEPSPSTLVYLQGETALLPTPEKAQPPCIVLVIRGLL